MKNGYYYLKLDISDWILINAHYIYPKNIVCMLDQLRGNETPLNSVQNIE